MTNVLHKNKPPATNHQQPKRVLFCVSLLGLVGLLFLATPAQAQRTVPYAEYLAIIGRLRGEVQTASNEESSHCITRLQEVATELEGITAVQLPDGSLMPVNHQGLRTAWSGFCWASEAEAYLGGICPALTCPATGITSPPGEQAGVPSLNDTANNQSNNANNIPAFNPGQPGNEQLLPGQQPGNLPAPNAPEQSPGDVTQPENTAENPTSADEQPSEQLPGNDSGEPAIGAEGQPGSQTASDEGQPGGSQPGEVGETGESSGETTGDTGETAETDGNIPEQSDSGTAPGSQPDPNQPQTDPNQPEAPGATPDLTVPLTETNWPLWIVVIVGVLLVVVVLLVIRARRNAKKRAQAAKRKRKPQEVTPIQAINEGRQLLAGGDYRTAVRQLFLAALLTLDERGILRFDPTLTNYELLDHAQLQPGLLLLLKPIIKTFEQVWYGFESLEAADYESLVQRIESLKQHSLPTPAPILIKLRGEA